MKSNSLSLTEKLFSLAVLITATTTLLTGSLFQVPFDIDELITVRYYTGAGINADGTMHPLDHLDDLRSRGRLSLKEFVMGIYCSCGRWSEPNNHIVNSFLVNTAFLLFPCSERAARLPAVAGYLLFAILMMYVIKKELKLYKWGLLALVLVLLLPYTYHYGQTARGYIWMLVLQVVHLILLLKSFDKPRSAVLALGSSMTGVLSIVNIISTLTFTVAPVYTSALLCAWLARSSDKVKFRERLINLCMQGALIALVCAVFFIDRLPELISSASLYGVSAGSFREIAATLSHHINYLFPSVFLKLFAAVGFVGLVLEIVAKRSENRFIVAVTGLVTLLFMLLQAVGTHKFGYDRVYGFLFLYSITGFIAVVDLIAQKVQGRYRYAIIAGVYSIVVAGSVFTFISDYNKKVSDAGIYSRFLERVRSSGGSTTDTTITLMSWNMGTRAPEMLYLPSGWYETDVALSPGQKVDVALLLRKTVQGWGFPSRVQSLPSWCPPDMEKNTIFTTDDKFRLVKYHGECVPLTPEAPDSSSLFVNWYIDPESMALSAGELFSLLQKSGVRYSAQQVRYQIKLKVFSRVSNVVLFSASAEEYATICRMIEKGKKQFGDRAVVVPLVSASLDDRRQIPPPGR